MSGTPNFLQLQGYRLLHATTAMKGRSELALVDFRCTEGLSMNYEIHATFTSQDPKIELKRMIGQPVTISLQLNNALATSDHRHFHGYVTRFSHTGTDGGLALYEATIRPWLWMLSRRQDIRIFQEITAQSIIAEVFREYGALASYEFRLSKETPNRSYCTQYCETDLNFVLRLIQEEGLFFYFEHEKGAHKLVITDDSTRAKPIDGISESMPYSQRESMDDIDVITSLHASRFLESGSNALKSRDYKVPGARRSALSKTRVDQGEVPPYEVYDYLGEHAYPAGDRGQELARFRSEALAAGSKVFSGTSTSRRLSPMRYVQIERHYDHQEAQPEDRQFMLVTVTHTARNNYQVRGGGAASYDCSFTCIRKKIPYRQALTIERPTIPGPQTATVVGPPGEEIYTDEMGRVKLQFHWDRLGKRDQGSSCWVRQSQSWAGRGFGMIHVPRIGDEVVVSFLDGSPDRPLITSRVVNGLNHAQWKLPVNRALSGMRSRELAGAQENLIVADDTPGKLQVHVSSDHAESRLVLGYNTRIDGNAGRAQARGMGWELATDSWGVLRANRGMLVTTETRAGASAAAKDLGETVQRLAQAREQHATLANAAVQAQAQDGQDQSVVTDALKTQNDEIGGQGGGDFPELSKAHLVLASPAGIEATTAGSTHIASGAHMAVTTGGHVSVSSGNNLLATARNAIRLFAYKLGIRMVSYAGDVDIKALQKNLNLLAKLDITQTANRITIKATEEVMLHGGDSYISLKNGKITVGGGVYEVNAQVSHMPSKPMGVAPDGTPTVEANDQTFRMLTPSGRSLPGVAYRMTADSGEHVFKTNDLGRSATVNTDQEENVKFAIHWDDLFVDTEQ